MAGSKSDKIVFSDEDILELYKICNLFIREYVRELHRYIKRNKDVNKDLQLCDNDPDYYSGLFTYGVSQVFGYKELVTDFDKQTEKEVVNILRDVIKRNNLKGSLYKCKEKTFKICMYIFSEVMVKVREEIDKDVENET